ncbi:MAG: DUF2284 domain-containing protein [Thermoplasmata archaeon]|nr:DUF2284 domain-containing protein [Thermoplasmata archaeon]
MEDWMPMCQQALAGGWSAERVPAPGQEFEDRERFLASCRENSCGRYGTSWSCPPGWTEGISSLSSKYPNAILLEKTFQADPYDPKAVESASDEAHRAVRSVTAAMRDAGIPCIGLSDGACGYCGVCSYPDECRYPAQLTPSISATGLDIGRFLESLGKGFSFSDSSFTLYCLVLFGDARNA